MKPLGPLGKTGIALTVLYALGGFFLIIPNPLWFPFFTITVWGLWALGAAALAAGIIAARQGNLEAFILTITFLIMGSIPYAIIIRGCVSGNLNCTW